MRDGMRALLDLVLPGECGGCGAPGEPWCPRCAASLAGPVRVRAPCCPDEPPVYALGEYRGALRAALLAYKERGRRDLAAVLGTALAGVVRRLGPQLGEPPAGWCLVPAPSRWTAVTRRGGSHTLLLAQRAAVALARTGTPAAVAPALRMARGVRDSVGLDRRARQRNLAGRVLVRRGGLPAPGVPVLLVDDVVTTGATAAQCTSALLRAGVRIPAIVVLAHSGQHVRS